MVKRIDHCWIPMPDGTRLGARIWLPETDIPCPGILEYIPYRKDDYSSIRDSTTIGHFAHHGYACLRVDMRGSGSSDGVLYDEYSDQEIDDGVAVIEWIAAQDWCDGQVATMGISWGGIAGLQLAGRRPQALKTIIALGASDQRYYDDAGYYMGCMVGQTLGWSAIMFGYNTRPPDPELVGDSWKIRWLDRLENTPHYLEHWFEHQHIDEYWKNNSTDQDYATIDIPVYAISGHVDCWPNTVSRLLQNLDAPVRGLQGAWCHRYPHMGIPGPTVDFLGDALRWFDHWMKGEDTGVMNEAAYQVYLQDSVRPQTYYEKRPGRWIGLSAWPSDEVHFRKFHLGQRSLQDESVANQVMQISSPQTVGLLAGEYMPWFAFGPGAELADDQQAEDAGSLTFDTEVLEQPLQILGNPVAKLRLASDRPQALLAARICDVWPDGASTLITRGVLNLSQRGGKSNPRAMPTNDVTDIEVTLNHVGYVVPSGHQLRLSLSTSYWPIAWPAPEVGQLSIYSDTSSLQLPLLREGHQQGKLTKFGQTQLGEADSTTQLRPVDLRRNLQTDEADGRQVLRIEADNGKVRFERTAMEMGSRALSQFAIHSSDPLSASAEYEWEWEYGRDDWQVRTLTHTRITSDAEHFYLDAESTAWEGETLAFNKTWKKQFKRDHF